MLDAWLERHAASFRAALARVTTLHFGRFVLVRGRQDGTALGTRSLLMFESNFDGDLGPHLRELWAACHGDLDALLAHSEGWPLRSDADAFERSVRRHQRHASAFFAAHPGLTVTRVRADARLRLELGRFLDANRAELVALPALEIVRRARVALESTPGVELGPVERGLAGAPRSTFRILLGHAGSLVSTLLLAAFHDVGDWLRSLWHDTRAPEAEPARLALIAKQEGNAVVRGLTHVAELKPGSFRRGALRLALRVADELAHAAAFSGKLGGIASIHFARWVLLDDGRLVFFSNYEGSFEAYLGDFIERASRALTMIWSNTRDFPASFAWTFGGARDEAGFKRWTRAHQVPTPVWYSAYPELGVREVRLNAEIRETLSAPPDDARACWLLGAVRD
jgi:hypothetical protein